MKHFRTGVAMALTLAAGTLTADDAPKAHRPTPRGVDLFLSSRESSTIDGMSLPPDRTSRIAREIRGGESPNASSNARTS